MSGKRWPEEDMKLLRKLVKQNMPWRVIGAHLNRSGQAVFNKAKAMDLGAKPFTGNQSPAWMIIQQLCRDGRPRTVHELVEATGCARITIDLLLRRRREAGMAHVARWEQRPGCPIPHWLPVPGKCARKPRAKTNCQREKDRIKRMKKEDPLRYEAYLAKKRVRTHLRRHGTQQHEIVSAMFPAQVTP